MLAHRLDQRARQIDAHFPVHPLAGAVSRHICERAVRRVGELACPSVEQRLAGRARHLIERVHPLREVVEVLAVALPLESLVEGLAWCALGQGLPDPEAAASRLGFSLLVCETADPSSAAVVGAMPTENVVHAMDQLERQLREAQLSRHVREPRKLHTANASVHR